MKCFFRNKKFYLAHYLISLTLNLFVIRYIYNISHVGGKKIYDVYKNLHQNRRQFSISITICKVSSDICFFLIEFRITVGEHIQILILSKKFKLISCPPKRILFPLVTKIDDNPQKNSPHVCLVLVFSSLVLHHNTDREDQLSEKEIEFEACSSEFLLL